MKHSLWGLSIVIFFAVLVQAQDVTPKRVKTPIELATYPSLTPDGEKLLFGWAGDLWIANSNGGRSRKLTTHPAVDDKPLVSPDGSKVAFISNRSGSNQVWVMNLSDGTPRQVTFHSEGSRIADWYPDSKQILVEGSRDYATRSTSRFYRVDLNKKGPEKLLFDAEGYAPTLSPDGKRLLFYRETGDGTYRKGYRGSRAAQIWMAENLESKNPKFTKIIHRDSNAKFPMWKADGSGFYYLGDHGENSIYNVWEYTFTADGNEQLDSICTKHDQPAVFARIARSGGKIVYRSGFHFHTYSTESSESKQLKLFAQGDAQPDYRVRRSLTKAGNISFTPDGLEMVFAAGGDLWAMDTVLKKPVQVTNTPEEEREPVFSKDGKTLFFIRDHGKTVDLWSVQPKEKDQYWWQSDAFVETQVTKDGKSKHDLQTVPGVERICWVCDPGNLWCANYDGSEPKLIVESWNQPSYSWSPKGEWVAWAAKDDDYNSDVWIAPYDGHREPYNLSRHPDYDGQPSWSPDGKILAFVGRRFETESDIYYVYLNQSDAEIDKQDRLYKSAVDKMKKYRKASTAVKSEPKSAEKDEPKKQPEPKKKEEDAKSSKQEAVKKPEPKTEEKKKEEDKATEKKPEKKLVIDFDGLYERIKRISIANSKESRLLWAPDSKRLSFAGEVKGVKGTYLVTFPDKLTPALLLNKQGSLGRWTKDDRIHWLANGIPQSVSVKSKSATSYSIRALQEYDRREYWRNGYWQIWRTMRDNWYDKNLNNLDWDEVGKRYERAAANAVDNRSFERATAMLLGELNGSHTGFKGGSRGSFFRSLSNGWQDHTAHLGVRFDPFHKGKGWKVQSVIDKGPADQKKDYLRKGDIVLQIDDYVIEGNDIDPYEILNGEADRTFELKVKRAGGKEKESESVSIRSFSYSDARSLLSEDLETQRRALVDSLSDSKLGYVYVAKMIWDDFIRFEEEIFARGAGKEGLIIDVRDNSGGFTADHLLTVLNPPLHAYTRARGSGIGYPQDRLVYATWKKPIIVLCNQNSYSNAEIFSHAIKELNRGQLVGVPTAGGVISTGSVPIRDMGTLRLPFRGWYRKSDGADMELNGAVPDHVVWPDPAELSQGKDSQISKAVKVLLEEIKNVPQLPKLIPASQNRPNRK